MPFAARPIQLAAAQTDELEALLRRKSTVSQGIAERARIILLAGDNLSNGEIAAKLGVHRNVVSKWRRRFLEGGVRALEDMPRSGRPPVNRPGRIKKLVETVCGRPPKGYGRWSQQLLAAKLKMPATTRAG